MTKRSADLNKKSINTQSRAPAKSKAAGNKAGTRAPFPGSISGLGSEIYWYAGLLLAFVISLYLRTIRPWNRVFVGDSVVFSSETDAWYHMMLAKGTVINLQRLWFDPMTNFPQGTPLHFGPFTSWGITILSYIADLGTPSTHTVEVVGAFFPAILGALVVIPVYFIGREIGGKACGLISALIVAVLPGAFLQRTNLGFTDHHAAEILLSTFTMMFFIMATRSGRGMTMETLRERFSTYRKPLLYSALAGVSLGLYLDAWPSGFLFEGILLAFIVIQSIVDFLKERNAEHLGITGMITFLVSALLVIPFVEPQNGFTNYYYSYFQPTILILGALSSIVIVLMARLMRAKGVNKYYFPGAVVGISAIGMILLSIIIPQFMGILSSGLSIFQSRTGGAATIGEASPILFPRGVFDLAQVQYYFPGFFLDSGFTLVFLSPFFLSMIALVIMLLGYVRSQKKVYLLMIIWSAVILALTIAQNRFAYYYAVNVAVLSGYLAVSAMRSMGINEDEGIIVPSGDRTEFIRDNAKVALAALGIFAVLIYPGLTLSYDDAASVDGPATNWLTATEWLKNNTPSPGMDIYAVYEHPENGKYQYPETAYGVMSWWDYGHLIEVVGHRLPNANPFQQGIGSKTNGVAGSSPFFISESEDEAEEVLKNLDLDRSPYMNTKYVMIDYPMASSKFHAMASWSSIPVSRYYGPLIQDLGNGGLKIATVYRESFYKTMAARLYYFDGSERAPSNGFAIAYKPMMLDDGSTYPVATESPMISSDYAALQKYVNESRENGYTSEIVGSYSYTSVTSPIPLDALKHYRLVHESETVRTADGQKDVKTFEHVPGAIITGTAAPGTEAVITVPITTNQGRSFEYRQTATTGADGKYTLVVPYSTEGPVSGGTNFDTKPSAPYTLTLEGRYTEVRIPEVAVMNGETLTVG